MAAGGRRSAERHVTVDCARAAVGERAPQSLLPRAGPQRVHHDHVFPRKPPMGQGVNPDIDVDRLSVVSGGSGDAVLLIHGFGFSKFTWRHICQSLAHTFTYYAVDLPGAGNSLVSGNFDFSLESLADVIARLIIRRNLKSLTLVGWSLGGGIALLALLRHRRELSGRVKALCIVDGIAYPQKFPFFVGLPRIPVLGSALVNFPSAQLLARAMLRFCYFDRSLITHEQIAEYASHLQKETVRRALIKTARSIDVDRLTKYIAQLGLIDVPALLIWGRDDRVVPLRIGQQLATELKHSKLIVVERCGHMPHEERPDEMIAIMQRFFNQK